MNGGLRFFGMCLMVALLAAAITASARAQFTGKGTPKNPQMNPNGPVLFPNLGNQQAPNQQQLTPEQKRAIMQYRALQSRSGQVRTGVPQFIPFGNPGFMPAPMANPQAMDPPKATRKSSAQKRAEARQAREEQKRVAKEKADAKKAKAAKQGE